MLRRHPSKWLLLALPFFAGLLSLWLLEASRLEQPATIVETRQVGPDLRLLLQPDARA